MLLKKNKTKTARQVVRRYLMDLIYRTSGGAVLVPSYNVLSKELGVARSTAQAELNLLRDEGFIITKVGVGSFTNPACYHGGGRKRLKLYTIIRGDGKIVYAGYHLIALFGEVAKALAALSGTVQEVQLYSHSMDEMFDELQGILTDAIIWIDPPVKYYDLLRRIDSIHPVITVKRHIDGLSGVVENSFELGYRTARAVLRNGRTKPLLIFGTGFDTPEVQGWVKAYAENGLTITPEQHHIACGSPCYTFWEDLQAYFAAGNRPDCILYALERELDLLDTLKRFQIDLTTDCRLLANTYKPLSVDAPVLMLECRFDWFAQAVARLVWEITNGAEHKPEHRMVSLIRDDVNYSGELL